MIYVRLHQPSAPIAKNTTLACPRCGRRITVALPTITAICHDRHHATTMRPVDDTTSTQP